MSLRSRPSAVIAATCAVGLASALLISGAGTAGAKAGHGSNNHSATARQVKPQPAAKAATTTSKYVQVDAMSFVPDSNGSADDYFNSWDNGLTSGTNQCFNAGVVLPNAAKVTSVKAFYVSGNGSDLNVSLIRHDLKTGAGEYVGNATALDDSGDFSSVTFAPTGTTPVASSRYSYGIGICLGEDTALKGVRVNYS